MTARNGSRLMDQMTMPNDGMTGCELKPSSRIINNHAGYDDYDDYDVVQIAGAGMLPETWKIRDTHAF